MQIKLICDIYNENLSNIDNDRYKKLVDSNVEYLGKEVHVLIDRPLGSKPVKEHPDFEYKLNYGYVPNTVSGDGEELDCYVLGVDIPIKEFDGECIAIIHRLNEDDDKLIVVPKDKKYSIREIEELTYFSEQHHKSFVFAGE